METKKPYIDFLFPILSATSMISYVVLDKTIGKVPFSFNLLSRNINSDVPSIVAWSFVISAVIILVGTCALWAVIWAKSVISAKKIEEKRSKARAKT